MWSESGSDAACVTVVPSGVGAIATQVVPGAGILLENAADVEPSATPSSISWHNLM
jgi:hypothetical protein